MDFFEKVTKQIAEFFKNLTPGKQLASLLTGACLITAIVGMFFWAGQASYVPLMTNLNPEDAANIMRILREKAIPFKVDTSGRNISIPPEAQHQLRLELAAMGLPQSSVVGYELFDKQSLGVTSFVQKINQNRALEGELIRTINTIKGVKRSRVHLAIPQRSAFVEDQKRASASVALDLEPNVQLNEKQVFGIGNLVARAVPGMEPADVVIVDSNGKTLSKNTTDAGAQATATQLDFQQKVEGEMEKRIEELLGRVVGEGKVVAKVTAELDFSQSSETQTTYDQDGAAVRTSEKRNENANAARPAPIGAAGAASNTPGTDASNQYKTDTTKINEVNTYEIPQTVRRTTKPSGQIKKISVAVVVDGKTVKTTGKDGVVTSKVDPWPQDKLDEFRAVISSAVAFDAKRGDTLEIKNLEFTHEDFDEAAKQIAESEQRAYMRALAVNGLIGLLIILFFWFVVRHFIKWLTENTIDSVDTFLPQTIEELEKMQKNQILPGLEEAIPVLPDKIDPEKVEGDMIKEKITTLVENNPHKAALILHDWLHSAAKSAGKEAEAPAGGGAKGGGGGKATA